MNRLIGRPNKTQLGHDAGFGRSADRQLKFAIALTTEAQVDCQRRNKKDAETNPLQDTVWFPARDPRRERGMQEARAPGATSTTTGTCSAAGKTNGKSAGVSHDDSKGRLGDPDMVLDERNGPDPLAGNRQCGRRRHAARDSAGLRQLHDQRNRAGWFSRCQRARHGQCSAAALPKATPNRTIQQLFDKAVKDAYFLTMTRPTCGPTRATRSRQPHNSCASYPQVKIVVEGHCDERGSTRVTIWALWRPPGRGGKTIPGFAGNYSGSRGNRQLRQGTPVLLRFHGGVLAAESPWTHHHGEVTQCFRSSGRSRGTTGCAPTVATALPSSITSNTN